MQCCQHSDQTNPKQYNRYTNQSLRKTKQFFLKFQQKYLEHYDTGEDRERCEHCIMNWRNNCSVKCVQSLGHQFTLFKISTDLQLRDWKEYLLQNNYGISTTFGYNMEPGMSISVYFSIFTSPIPIFEENVSILVYLIRSHPTKMRSNVISHLFLKGWYGPQHLITFSLALPTSLKVSSLLGILHHQQLHFRKL